jgi:hypothetical protein
VKAYKTIGSPGYPTDEKEIRRRVAEDFKRSNYPAGFSRQMAAALVNGDRRAALKRIKAPTVVIHGADDPLVPIEAGRDTAANIAGAELIEIPGMGHDLPAALYSRIVDAIESVAKRAPRRCVVGDAEVAAKRLQYPQVGNIFISRGWAEGHANFSKLDPLGFIGHFDRLRIACVHRDADKRSIPGPPQRTPNPLRTDVGANTECNKLP